MRDEEIRIGDRLRIREWDDMEAEFGIDNFGDITPHIEYRKDGSTVISHEVFVDKMRDLCGHTFTVSEINRYDSFINDYNAEEPEFDDWTIEAWMLEPIMSDQELEHEEPDALFGFLLS